MEIHNAEHENRGSYIVDCSLHPWKDLQLVKGNVMKAWKGNVSTFKGQNTTETTWYTR
jgi:hypothetical protein